MSFALLTFGAAIILGMRHATDPDHVIAVSTILAREPSLRRATGVGVLWGAGHTVTILLVGGAIIVFRMRVPANTTAAFETCVAGMLILLGVRNLCAAHSHGSAPAGVPPFAIGVVHGLAGSAAAALLIVPLIRDPMIALVYLMVFGAGTILGMTLLTTAITGSTLYATRRIHGLDRWVRLSAGAMSVCFGALMLLRLA